MSFSVPSPSGRGRPILVNLATLTCCLENVLSLARNDHNMQSNTLQDMAIAVGLAKAPFVSLVVNKPLSIHTPFDPD